MTDKLPSAKFPPWGLTPATKTMDMVHSPPHYTYGKFEAIDVIEDAVQFAPDATLGTLQWQVLKYVLRMWHKGKALEDAKKAQWYLNRLIDKMESK